jgi:hypothetical protein
MQTHTSPDFEPASLAQTLESGGSAKGGQAKQKVTAVVRSVTAAYLSRKAFRQVAMMPSPRPLTVAVAEFNGSPISGLPQIRTRLAQPG